MIQRNGHSATVAESEKMLGANGNSNGGEAPPPPYELTALRNSTVATVTGFAKLKRPTISRFAAIFCHRFRFFVLILGTLCLSSIFSNMIVINFTVICMDPDSHVSALGVNKNVAHVLEPSSHNPQHAYTQLQKTIVQWTVSIASGIATFPLSYACTRYGARWPFLLSGLLSAVFTALVPMAIEAGFGALVVIRIFQGLAYACDFAVVGVLCTRWASLRENAIFLAVLTSFTPLSSFLTNTSSGAICESNALGWPYAYYFHAAIGLFLFVGWFVFYTDNPQDNCYVTAAELTTIHYGKSLSHINHESFIPYKAICKTPVIWAVWLNAFVDLFCGLFIILYAPTYIKKVLHYGLAETGVLGGVIILAKLPVKVVCGLLSDMCHCMPERFKMCVFNTIAVCVPGTVYIVLCYVPEHLPLIAVVLFAVTEASTGANCGGFYKCGSLASRQYAEFAIACTQFIKCLVFFVAPALVALFVQNETDATQWHVIFFIIAGSLFLANIVFCIYATDKPCAFTSITRQNAAAEKTGATSVENDGYHSYQHATISSPTSL